MTVSFKAIICLVLGVICISVLTNCTEDVMDGDLIVTDPSAKSDVFKKVDDYTLIVKNPGVTRKKRNAIVGSENHWTGGIVPYGISSTFSESERKVVLESMKHWEDCTCIRFRPRTDSDIYSVMFMPGNGCNSFVGRIGQSFQPQGISLGVGCFFLPVIVHEIGHALGFFHEHSRADRDNYVRVIASNILQGLEYQFDTVDADQATTLNLGYDYASIMHYSSTTFARQGTSALIANDPNIPIGDAQELSPLDAAKANRLYNCSSRPLPPPSIIIPEESIVTVPNGISCGSVTQVNGPGSVTSPQFPTHIFNEECAFVLEAPEGFGFSISFPQFSLDPTIDCTEDYVQIYRGASNSFTDLIRYGGFTDGRICNRQDSRLIFFVTERIATIYYRTNGRNTRSDVSGLRISYDLRDIDECQSNQRGNRCHSCTNLPGSFECNCRDGYYHSFAANTCFDVNECAFGNGGCAQTCINFGGSYRCSCNNGLFLQADGLSCGTTNPPFIQTPTPGTIIPKEPPSVTTTPPPSPTPPTCGGQLTAPTGSFNTPNWPSTYPFNFSCVWNIVLSDPNAIIEISFDDDFGIGGQMPDCTKDQLFLFDGGNNESQQLGVFCHLTRPDPIRTTSNRLTVMFVSASSHGPTRHGFRASYISVLMAPPTTISPPTTTPPPTTISTTTIPATTVTIPTSSPAPTLQLPQCGGGFQELTFQSGSLQTFNWPNSPYATNIVCDWDIECPVGNTITIQFEDSFRVAGRMPDCTKDQLTISGCDQNYGPYCHLTAPQPFTTTCNAAHVSFQAGSERGDSRTGFQLNYVCTASPGPSPIAPTVSPQCGGGETSLIAPSGSIQTLNWPNDPYPINTECLWDINCPAGVEINFETSFRVAGRMPECSRDQLEISGCGTDYGPYCHLTAPDQISTTCNKVNVLFRSASERGISRTGFRLNYRCL